MSLVAPSPIVMTRDSHCFFKENLGLLGLNDEVVGLFYTIKEVES